MKQLIPPKKQKSTGQAMVEFALVLPILLTLLYGMMETGRLLFIYASTVTAARQAARYGSATGSVGGVPYYQDCNGIRNSARSLEFINRFDTINIGYDKGLDSGTGNPIDLSPANPACGAYTSAANGDRIKVTVTTLWQPIVPLVPLRPITITSISERTILASVVIVVDAPVVYTGGNLTLSISAPTPYTAAGQVVEYTYTLKNTGATAAVSTQPFSFILYGNMTLTTCTPATAPSTLAAGASYICKGNYTIKQADVDRGYVDNSIGSQPNATPATATTRIYATQSPAFTIVKSANPTVTSVSVTYTYALKNTGNVTLLTYRVTDDRLGLICSGVNLAPNATAPTAACQKVHPVTAQEKLDGSIVNTATAVVTYNKYDQPTDSASIITLPQNSNQVTVLTTALSLIVRSNPTNITTLQSIDYEFIIYNNTAAAIGPLSVTIKSFTGTGDQTNLLTISCPASIPASGSVTCTTPPSSYISTQPDLDSGLITIEAKATAGVETSNKATANVTVTVDPKLALTSPIKTASNTAWPDVALKDDPLTPQKENEITYTYEITNTGNVTLLAPFTITDDVVTTGITCGSATSLAPIASVPSAKITCTGVHAFTTELDNFSYVVNTASAHALYGGVVRDSNPATSKVWMTADDKRLLLTVTAPASVVGENAQIAYGYTLTNIGRGNLTSPFTFTGYKKLAPNCGAGTITIIPGASINCTESAGTPYKTTEQDVIDAKTTATVNATASSASGSVSSANTKDVAVGPNSSCNIAATSALVAPTNGNNATFTMITTIPNTNSFTLRISGLDITYPNIKSPTSASYQFITNVALGASTIWTNSNPIYTNLSSITISITGLNNNVPPPIIAAGQSVALTVNLKYKNASGTKRVVIHFSTPGCESKTQTAQ